MQQRGLPGANGKIAGVEKEKEKLRPPAKVFDSTNSSIQSSEWTATALNWNFGV